MEALSADGQWQPYAGAVIGALTDDPGDGFGVLHMYYDGRSAAFVIARADPRVRLFGRLVREALGDSAAPGAKVVICGTDRRVVYVLGRFHEAGEHGASWWEAEWPD